MSGALHPQSEFYLHVNGEVHYKPHGDVERDSPNVVEVWNANNVGKSPEHYLEWLKELKVLGTSDSELSRLVQEQNLTKWIPDALKQLSETYRNPFDAWIS